MGQFTILNQRDTWKTFIQNSQSLHTHNTHTQYMQKLDNSQLKKMLHLLIKCQFAGQKLRSGINSLRPDGDVTSTSACPERRIIGASGFGGSTGQGPGGGRVMDST